nr:hypothetical protein [Arsenophonus endosymbiont of Aleurodicus floccissimus]
MITSAFLPAISNLPFSWEEDEPVTSLIIKVTVCSLSCPFLASWLASSLFAGVG